MIITRWAILAPWFFVATDLPACVWEYGTALNGKSVMAVPGYGIKPDPIKSPVFWREHKSQLEEKLKTSPDFRTESDIAVSLIHLGEYDAAIEKLEAIEKSHPGEYAIASNLGTAFELAGKNAPALRWIKEGISRNANAHEGTEWVHVKILEAKLAVEQDPDWLHSHAVLGMDFGIDKIPHYPLFLPGKFEANIQSYEAIAIAIVYQLRERMVFVNPPDPYVADLLFEYANLVALMSSHKNALLGTLEKSVAALDRAHEFGFYPEYVLVERRNYFSSVIARSHRNTHTKRQH